MQSPPLLKKLDWVFTNASWTLSFPNTTCKALVMEISDHNPMVITISTAIPKVHIFRFENYWLQRQGFNEILLERWNNTIALPDKARSITQKFKSLRSALRTWSSKISNLKSSIANISQTLQWLDVIEEYRDLSLEEWNFRSILREKMLSLLEQQRIYWKQRKHQMGDPR